MYDVQQYFFIAILPYYISCVPWTFNSWVKTSYTSHVPDQGPGVDFQKIIPLPGWDLPRLNRKKWTRVQTSRNLYFSG